MAWILLLLGIFLTGCSIPPRDEVVAGVTIPIPGGMSRTADQRVEISLAGFGGGHVAYRGSAEPEEIVTFYQTEMPARGWKPNASLVTQGGLLAYSKDNKSVLIMVSKSSYDTTLAIIVGTKGP